MLTTIAAVSAGPAEQAGKGSSFVEGPRLSFGFCSLSCFTCQPCAGTEAVLPPRGSCRLFGPPSRPLPCTRVTQRGRQVRWERRSLNTGGLAPGPGAGRTGLAGQSRAKPSRAEPSRPPQSTRPGRTSPSTWPGSRGPASRAGGPGGYLGTRRGDTGPMSRIPAALL